MCTTVRSLRKLLRYSRDRRSGSVQAHLNSCKRETAVSEKGCGSAHHKVGRARAHGLQKLMIVAIGEDFRQTPQFSVSRERLRTSEHR
jgi:hypothetical protein